MLCRALACLAKGCKAGACMADHGNADLQQLLELVVSSGCVAKMVCRQGMPCYGLWHSAMGQVE
jgi:hypothetical protein